MTCQEISSITRYHYRPTIIVLNNNGYTTEKGLDIGIKKANTIYSWNYEKLIELIGSGRYIGNIKTEKDLDLALYRCFDMTGALTSAIKEKEKREAIKLKEKIRNLQQLQQQGKYYHENKFNDHEDNDANKLDEKYKYNNDDDNGNIYNEEPPTNLIDKIYCKEMGCLIPFEDYVIAYKERELDHNNNNSYEDDNDKNNEVDNKSKGKDEENGEYKNENENDYLYTYQKIQEEKEKPLPSTYLKLKSNYLTLIEIKLDELDMSYGSQQFITLSQKN